MSNIRVFRARSQLDAESALAQRAGAWSDDWLVLGIPGARGSKPARDGPGGAADPTSGITPLASPAQLLDASIDLVLVVEPGQAAGLSGLVGPLSREFAGTVRGLAPLVRRVSPPDVRVRNEGPVRSFACTAALFQDLVATGLPAEFDRLCFRVLHGVFYGPSRVARLVVRQFPSRADDFRVDPIDRDLAVILPHRGPPDYLDAALRHLPGSAAARASIRVGLDEGDVSGYGAIIAAHPGNDYYQAASPPVGPYFVRQALAERSREAVLAFHDSDDLSCWDRFGCLEAERVRTGCDLIGSNELRFDELEGDVTAFRYPLDASAALGMAPGHALFFPTSMITRAGFFRAGGLSTDRAFAYDTQFLLRAFFSLKIRNVDKFLYVRRRRAGSLTTSPETGMGTPIRERLAARWEHDFEEVKSGRLTLEGSSLATCHAPGGDLRSGLRRLSPRG